MWTRGKEVTIPSLPCLFVLVSEMLANDHMYIYFKNHEQNL